ncbi:DUF2029 domain-containing protein [Auraticoccus sp. F435]|uniref:DUF2029 domain-containing protein n=1 Tax=Auraticoccus cholistanensis TaxID=2656650 RepID=A0A6A9UTB9_9ACTN|nr:glycosyltransferase 87 family protein [Auraticoccus cholistanensis]MVA76063.1 DUF2029 domain-containing protein [Auraticoccus cholistanensis]
MTSPHPGTAAAVTTTPAVPWWGVLSAWLATRVLALVVWGLFELEATGDVLYYHRRIGEMFAGAGLSATLVEYPTPVVWLLSLPWLAGGGSQAGYLAGFVVAMLALDAWLTVLLHRSSARSTAVLFWVGFVPLLGPLTLLRFDMVPAVLAGVALLLVARRPAPAGALVGVGAAVKLWPALLVPALLGDRRRRGRVLLGFFGAGAGLALLSLVAGGAERLFSPLTWQSDRGLQVESVWATPVMLWHLLSPELHTIGMSRYQAFEVFGPHVAGWTSAADLSMLVGLAVMALLFVRTWRRGAASPLAAAAVMTAVVACMIVTNKTLSPQYVLWLGGPVAVLVQQVTSRPVPRRTSQAVVRLALGTLVLAALTHLVYPVLYSAIVYDPPGPAQTAAVLVLAVRNAGLVALTVVSVALAWRVTEGPAAPAPGRR